MRTRRSELIKVYTQHVLNLTKLMDEYHLHDVTNHALASYYDTCVKIMKFDPVFSISKCYDLIKAFKSKIAELERRPTYKLEPRPSIEVKFKGFNVVKGVLNIDDQAYVGKNRFANQKVYDHTRNRNYTWYHANVHGGGLVAIRNATTLTLSPAIALIFSKYLSVYNVSYGDVSKTNRIEKAPQIGGFYFKNSSTLRLDVKDVNVYYDLDGSIFTISFVDLNSGKLGYRPVHNADKYAGLTELLRSRKLVLDGKSRAMLDRIVPSGWGLYVVK